MSKGIIIVDMPETCGDCACCGRTPLGDECWAAEEVTKSVNSPPDWCPIKPIPQKKKKYGIDSRRVKSFKNGWNAAIDEMMGGNK